MAHFHFVANYESKIRILQLGEREENIFIIGSPDIDVMISNSLPEVKDVKSRHNIDFDEYAILIYHPVTTEVSKIEINIREVIKALEFSNKNYIIVYPNNDLGSDIIINEIEKSCKSKKYKLVRSLPFEDFLSLLKNSLFIIGNSSAGIREACVFGIPTVDIGTRQQGRYQNVILKNIQHTVENSEEILNCINQVNFHKFNSNYFGEGNSAKQFVEIIKARNDSAIQKKFIDISETQEAIQNYINEVCF